MANNDYELKSTSLINRGNSLFKTDVQTQLNSALRQRNKESFEKLLKLVEVNPNYLYSSPYNKTCLDIACSTPGMSEYVKLLLKNDADINKFNEKHHKAPIHFAAETGDVETIKVLVSDEGIDVNCLSKGNTALHLAIKEIEDLDDDREYNIRRYEEIVKVLVKAGTDVNIPDMKGVTPIYSAAKQGLENIIKYILDYSKKPVDLETYEDYNDKTAKMLLEETFPHLLKHSSISSKFDVVDINKLFSHLSDGKEDDFVIDLKKIKKDTLNSVLTQNNGLYTLIQWACKKGFDEAVKALLEKGADPNLTAPGNGIKPVAYACRGGYYKILKLLGTNDKTEFDPVDGESLLQFTIKGEEKVEENANVDYKKCLQILLKSDKANLDINYKGAIGNTALHYAIKNGDQNVVMELLKNKAYLGIKNKFGEPPLSDISPKTLKSYLDSCLTTNDERPNSDNYEIQFNYSFLIPPITGVNKNSSDTPLINKNETLAPETDILLYMSKHPNLKSLLKHPVITSFLYMKWERISCMFYFNLLFYVLFWLSLNLYILLGAEEFDTTITPAALMQTLKVLTIIGIIFLTIRETIQILVSPNKYWRSIENWLEVILIVVCYTFFFNNYFQKQQLHALAILLSSAELVLLIGQFPSLSTNIVMLKTVSWNFFKFLLWYCILIIAFALSFHTLFKAVNKKTKDEFDEKKPFDPNNSDKEDENNFFLDPGMSLFKTIIMLTGELEASDIDFKQSVMSYFIFILFVFMIPIVLFNLLNGLAVSDTQAIKDNAELVSVISRIQLISYFESILLGDTQPYKNAVSNAQNRCCWLPGHSCIKSRFICVRPLAEKISLFPHYLPMARVSIKINQQSKVEITKNESMRKEEMNEDNVEVGQSCLKTCVELKMEHQIVKSAKSIIANKDDEEDNDIKVLHMKLEELMKELKEVRNLVIRN